MKKTYKVNEIFYSLQGEGRNTGRAAVFIRFSGCNLKCSFCDTDFKLYHEMTAEAIVDAVREWKTAGFVVLTGGEPTLQVDGKLIDALHAEGFYVAMESNGTNVPPANLDWLTISPKEHVVVTECNELKCIFDGQKPVDDLGIEADYYYLQPCDVGNDVQNRAITQACIRYIASHPKWRLSLQTHKMIGFQ